MRIPTITPVSGVSRRNFLSTSLASAGALYGLPAICAAQGQQDKRAERKQLEDAVTAGLDWLKKSQAADGHWAANQGNYGVAMTGLAGMALLMEGSSLKEGRYSEQILKATEWLTSPRIQQQNGLIAEAMNGNYGSYIHGHGFATMFLACTLGDCEDKDQQKKLEKAVAKAVQFTAWAQTERKHKLPEGKTVDVGGWGYTAAKESGNFDEGSTTVTQLQALRAARNAGVAVPKETIDRAVAYLGACTTPKGGMIYSYASSNGVAQEGAERIPITAAAVACAFSAGQYKGDLAKKWIKFLKERVPIARGRVAHDEYQSYYFAQVVYVLGDDRYGKMFPEEDKSNWLTWSKYKDAMFPYLLEQQDKNSGAWTSGYIGPVFTTSINLAILQLEKGVLPLYQR